MKGYREVYFPVYHEISRAMNGGPIMEKNYWYDCMTEIEAIENKIASKLGWREASEFRDWAVAHTDFAEDDKVEYDRVINLIREKAANY